MVPYYKNLHTREVHTKYCAAKLHKYYPSEFFLEYPGICISKTNCTEFCGVHRVLFIENKTNHTEYCLNHRREHELVEKP